ncbi:MAG: ferredoxin [Planctomycetota bacterium]
MANKTQRYDDNTQGKWYVDKECIDCDLCNELAPKNFSTAKTDDHSIVFKQPETDEEKAQCQEALEGCPVEAIGNDG